MLWKEGGEIISELAVSSCLLPNLLFLSSSHLMFEGDFFGFIFFRVVDYQTTAGDCDFETVRKYDVSCVLSCPVIEVACDMADQAALR